MKKLFAVLLFIPLLFSTQQAYAASTFSVVSAPPCLGSSDGSDIIVAFTSPHDSGEITIDQDGTYVGQAFAINTNNGNGQTSLQSSGITFGAGHSYFLTTWTTSSVSDQTMTFSIPSCAYTLNTPITTCGTNGPTTSLTVNTSGTVLVQRSTTQAMPLKPSNDLAWSTTVTSGVQFADPFPESTGTKYYWRIDNDSNNPSFNTKSSNVVSATTPGACSSAIPAVPLSAPTVPSEILGSGNTSNNPAVWVPQCMNASDGSDMVIGFNAGIQRIDINPNDNSFSNSHSKNVIGSVIDFQSATYASGFGLTYNPNSIYYIRGWNGSYFPSNTGSPFFTPFARCVTLPVNAPAGTTVSGGSSGPSSYTISGTVSNVPASQGVKVIATPINGTSGNSFSQSNVNGTYTITINPVPSQNGNPNQGQYSVTVDPTSLPPGYSRGTGASGYTVTVPCPTSPGPSVGSCSN